MDWAGTVIRVKSDKRNEVIDIADRIRCAWIKYSNPELGIIAEDGNGAHNAISRRPDSGREQERCRRFFLRARCNR